MRRAKPIFICGGDLRPGPRDECPNALHDWPLPGGYVDAHDVAASRLRRQWANRRCPDCGLYGWVPGRLKDTDMRVERQALQDTPERGT